MYVKIVLKINITSEQDLLKHTNSKLKINDSILESCHTKQCKTLKNVV